MRENFLWGKPELFQMIWWNIYISSQQWWEGGKVLNAHFWSQYYILIVSAYLFFKKESIEDIWGKVTNFHMIHQVAFQLLNERSCFLSEE